MKYHRLFLAVPSLGWSSNASSMKAINADITKSKTSGIYRLHKVIRKTDRYEIADKVQDKSKKCSLFQ
ncbi:exported hypothetical protein [Bacillus subtilis]